MDKITEFRTSSMWEAYFLNGLQNNYGLEKAKDGGDD